MEMNQRNLQMLFNGHRLSEKEIKLAQSKLIKHYKKAGFENIKGINKRYLFSL